jgi:hypothetical protein
MGYKYTVYSMVRENTQTWGFTLLEALYLETLLLRSVKNMEITIKNITIDNAQTAIIPILED